VDLSERSVLLARRHPWELARQTFFEGVLRSHKLLESPARWLDVGAGDGWLASQLRNALPDGTEMVCWDVNYTDADLADGAHAAGVTLTAERPNGRFDRVLLLDVIEHVEDDHGFLSGIVADLLAPGGSVLLSVPAYQSLFSEHDVALGHYRRYSQRQGRELIKAAGLEAVAEGGVFHALLLPRAVQALVDRLRRRRASASEGTDNKPDPVGVGQWNGGKRLTALIASVLRGEGRLSLALGRRKVAVPGLSYWALCRVGD
jgi:SAM-dependent methyltransferase